MLLTLASSGCRVSEVVTLTTPQLVSREGHFFVEVLGKNQTETRLAPLTSEAYASIEAWLARRPVEGEAIFTSFAGRGLRPTARPMHLSSAWRVVARYARQSGLQHISPHSLRRFVGTQVAKKDLRQGQKILGHADIGITARHYLLDELAGGLTDGLF